jgi:hypothetical protein
MELTFRLCERNDKEFNYKDVLWNLDQQIDVDEFLDITAYPFEKAGWIEAADNEAGYQLCANDRFKDKTRLLYLLVVDGKVLKGGKVKGTLRNRSYKAGTENSWNITGKASPTNYVYSQIFRECVKNNEPVEFYLYECEKQIMRYPTSQGGFAEVAQAPYEEMESTLNAHLKEVLGHNPIGDGDLELEYKE